MGPVMPPSKKPESSGISVSSGLSQCYRGSSFSQALQEDDDLDFSLPDIRLEEGAMEDEELTNLNWLHESKNLLKSFGESVLRSVSPVQDLDDDTPPSPAHSDLPYDARQNPNCKPPYSFSCLIFMAIEDSPSKRLPVKDIYSWILEHFPYFENAPTGWKNSVRHNLSLNKCFKKVDKERSQVSLRPTSLTGQSCLGLLARHCLEVESPALRGFVLPHFMSPVGRALLPPSVCFIGWRVSQHGPAQ